MIYVYLNPDGSVEATREISPVGSSGNSERFSKAAIVLELEDYSLSCRVVKSRYLPVAHSFIKDEDAKLLQGVLASEAITEEISKSAQRQGMKMITREEPSDLVD